MQEANMQEVHGPYAGPNPKGDELAMWASLRCFGCGWLWSGVPD
jgi:hypothetical protein